jgi:hypothetical protein
MGEPKKNRGLLQRVYIIDRIKKHKKKLHKRIERIKRVLYLYSRVFSIKTDLA